MTISCDVAIGTLEVADAISPTPKRTPAAASARRSMRWAVSAARRAAASGMSSVCSARSVGGLCGKDGAAGPVRIEQPQGIPRGGTGGAGGVVWVWGAVIGTVHESAASSVVPLHRSISV